MALQAKYGEELDVQFKKIGLSLSREKIKL
jgi:hypothetical protein